MTECIVLRWIILHFHTIFMIINGKNVQHKSLYNSNHVLDPQQLHWQNSSNRIWVKFTCFLLKPCRSSNPVDSQVNQSSHTTNIHLFESYISLLIIGFPQDPRGPPAHWTDGGSLINDIRSRTFIDLMFHERSFLFKRKTVKGKQRGK